MTDKELRRHNAELRRRLSPPSAAMRKVLQAMQSGELRILRLITPEGYSMPSKYAQSGSLYVSRATFSGLLARGLIHKVAEAVYERTRDGIGATEEPLDLI
jgi:hypothetical protein